MNHLHPLMFTVFSCSFLTLKGEKISSGRAKDEKQNKDIHCIDTTDLKIKKTSVSYRCTQCYESILQITSEHHFKFWFLLTHQIFTRAVNSSNLDIFFLMLLSRASYPLVRLLKVNMNKRVNRKEWKYEDKNHLSTGLYPIPEGPWTYLKCYLFPQMRLVSF